MVSKSKIITTILLDPEHKEFLNKKKKFNLSQFIRRELYKEMGVDKSDEKV